MRSVRGQIGTLFPDSLFTISGSSLKKRFYTKILAKYIKPLFSEKTERFNIIIIFWHGMVLLIKRCLLDISLAGKISDHFRQKIY
jgi:hypothetical protein